LHCSSGEAEAPSQPTDKYAGFEGIKATAFDKPFGYSRFKHSTCRNRFSTRTIIRNVLLHPSVIAFAWPRVEQDVKPYIDRAHAPRCKVTFMAGGVAEAMKRTKAGADVIIVQG
jgi:NAD(P)H-dependent flavin oxidoreductase YrpB (nitropropane dioxygenase family)